MELTLRKAGIEDFPEVCSMYSRAVESMHAQGMDQWDAEYPSAVLLREDIEKGHMYLGILEGRIVSAVVLNEDHDIAYDQCRWLYEEEAYPVVHRLCVDPDAQRGGVGLKTMELAEALLKKRGYRIVRLDAFSLNPPAVQLYERLGYNRSGAARWRKGHFYLYEKRL